MRRGGTRGQSEIIGFILAFGLVVTLIGANQAFIVPQANEDVEAQHDEDVQTDMLNLRGEIIDAAASNEQQTATVRLGTGFPPRFLAVNPPPTSGTLQTVRPSSNDGNITVKFDGDLDIGEICGTEPSRENVSTRFLAYDASYSEYRGNLPITVENSVMHRNQGTLVSSEQVVVKGNRIRITRVVGDFRTSASDKRSVDLFPSETGANTTNKSVTVTLPTELGEDDWERLANESEPNVKDVSVEDGAVEIELKEPNEDDPDYVVECTTVGIEQEPDVDPATPADDEIPDSDISLNPIGGETLELTNVESGSNSDLDVSFRNNGSSSLTLKKARIPFFTSTGGDAEIELYADMEQVNNNNGTILVAGDPLEPVGERTWGTSEEKVIYIDIDGPVPQTAFALELQLVDQEGDEVEFIYFISDSGGS